MTRDKIDTLKGVRTPPAAVLTVAKAWLIMLKGEYKKHDWDEFKKMIR